MQSIAIAIFACSLSLTPASQPTGATTAVENPAATAAPISTTAIDPYTQPVLHIPWDGISGRGFSLFYTNGSWGGRWANGIGFQIPLYKFLSMRLRGITLYHGPDLAERFDVLGRFEFIGRSPVFINLVRLYGGGGVQVSYALKGEADAKVRVGGGGYFGFEFFLWRAMSFFLEVGGSSGAQSGSGSGASIEAGIQIYPMANRR